MMIQAFDGVDGGNFAPLRRGFSFGFEGSGTCKALPSSLEDMVVFGV